MHYPVPLSASLLSVYHQVYHMKKKEEEKDGSVALDQPSEGKRSEGG